MERSTTLRKNPSREACENIIKRILMTEVLEHGRNKHFRFASDFMNYFESLYPASDALTKQVQRAIKSLDMPKDEQGYFIVNKTTAQLENEKEISHLIKSANISVHPMEAIETVFLSVNSYMKSYLIHLIETTEIFQGKYITIVETSNGLLIYTENKNQLLTLLNSLTI
ncbi:MAG: hypothetical protein IJP06_03670 [Agathobacter sp.]|nr:hypothetical protein [Agathobacter sp.]